MTATSTSLPLRRLALATALASTTLGLIATGCSGKDEANPAGGLDAYGSKSTPQPVTTQTPSTPANEIGKSATELATTPPPARADATPTTTVDGGSLTDTAKEAAALKAQAAELKAAIEADPSSAMSEEVRAKTEALKEKSAELSAKAERQGAKLGQLAREPLTAELVETYLAVRRDMQGLTDATKVKDILAAHNIDQMQWTVLSTRIDTTASMIASPETAGRIPGKLKGDVEFLTPYLEQIQAARTSK